MLKFSIVTCTWNSLPFLTQCINSVQSQTGVEIEHIFVDGGSTDGTLECIKGLDGNVRYLTDVRGGISNAMNVGLRHCSGDVVMHLHGDDYLYATDVLSRVAKKLDESQAQWLFGKIISDIDGAHVMPVWKMPKYSREQLLKGNFIAHPATFVRRSLFLQGGEFDTSLRYAMDYDMWLRLSSLAAPVCYDEYLSVFRRHSASASTANVRSAFEEDHAVRKRYLSGGMLPQGVHNLRFIWRRWRRYGELSGAPTVSR